MEFSYRQWMYAAAILLLLPALLINLGLLAFIDDESIRALVALEMKLSGNYIAPTLHGEFYYNKPPLFNWILLTFFELAGRVDEFTARSVTVLALGGFAATIFYFFKRHYDARTAFLNAFMFVTCGRVLFWDSMLALIDITFSWVVFVLFMVVYHEMERERYWRLFLVSYLLTAVAFLMKGLPAVVFQGTTLLVYFAYRGRFRRLFSWAHVAGALAFATIAGAYYLAYHQFNSLQTVFSTLVTESSKRTVADNSWSFTILHLFTFPFEMVYHFLPWSLFVIYFIRRDAIDLIRRDPFIAFNLVAFLGNIIIYWTSPEVFPRYLLMLTPLLFSAFLHLHGIHEEERSWQYRSLSTFFFALLILVAAGSLAPLFMEERLGWIPWRLPKTLSAGAGLMALLYLYGRLKQERLLVMILFLLVFRIEFNWFVIPDRNANDFGDLCRKTSQAAGERFAGQLMYLYGDVEMQTTNSFYLTQRRGAIIPRKKDNFDPGAVYIIDPVAYRNLSYKKLSEIRVRHGELTYDIGTLPKQ